MCALIEDCRCVDDNIFVASSCENEGAKSEVDRSSEKSPR